MNKKQDITESILSFQPKLTPQNLNKRTVRTGHFQPSRVRADQVMDVEGKSVQGLGSDPSEPSETSPVATPNPGPPGWGTVPPVDLPPNLPRPDLAQVDARLIMEFVTKQIPSEATTPSCGWAVCEWCLVREGRYWTSFHWSHEDCALAAACDLARWQQGVATNAELLFRLRAFEELSQGKPAMVRLEVGSADSADPWLPIAEQVVAGCYDAADLSAIQSILIGLRNNPHSTAHEAVERLLPLEKAGIKRRKREEARLRKQRREEEKKRAGL